MTKMIAYVFECGHEGAEIVKKNKQMVCPECNARLIQKKYKCQKCKKMFYNSKNGSHAYCKKCAEKIKKATHSAWLKKNGKQPKQRKSTDAKPLEEIHDRVDCIYRRECLTTRIVKDPNICLTCNEYISEFDSIERYV